MLPVLGQVGRFGLERPSRGCIDIRAGEEATAGPLGRRDGYVDVVHEAAVVLYDLGDPRGTIAGCEPEVVQPIPQRGMPCPPDVPADLVGHRDECASIGYAFVVGPVGPARHEAQPRPRNERGRVACAVLCKPNFMSARRLCSILNEGFPPARLRVRGGIDRVPACGERIDGGTLLVAEERPNCVGGGWRPLGMRV